MLRQFSVRRIVGFFLIDWLGSLAMLFCAAILRLRLGNLSKPAVAFLGGLHIQVGGVGGVPCNVGFPLPICTFFGGEVGNVWPLMLAVAVIWPVCFASFSV